MEITKSFTFDAAHHLNTMGEAHKYSRMHGHSFRVEITLAGDPDPKKGWIEDFAVVTDALNALHDRLDHMTLNDIPGLETPTLENLCQWIARELKPHLPQLAAVRVERPSIGEACKIEI